jgi:nucleoside-diphosphate-sugar epimerase
MNSELETRKVVVLGINGHLGAAAARAFVAAGWAVTGFGRSERQKVDGVRFVQGDADDIGSLRAAIAGQDVIVNALNLRYDQWFEGRAEAQLARVIEAGRGSGATLLFPGNIYNYAASAERITPLTPEHPETPRGEIRVRLEKRLEAATSDGGLRAFVLRAGDFYGPGASSDWFDQLILREAKRGRVALANHEIRHTWAYLPDLGRALVQLAEKRAELGPFERFHFAGHFVSAGELFRAIEKQAGRKLKRVTTPWFLLKVMGWFNPVLREVVKMRYLFENPMALEDPKLEALLGRGFDTPFEAAVGATVAPFFR